MSLEIDSLRFIKWGHFFRSDSSMEKRSRERICFQNRILSILPEIGSEFRPNRIEKARNRDLESRISNLRRQWSQFVQKELVDQFRIRLSFGDLHYVADNGA